MIEAIALDASPLGRLVHPRLNTAEPIRTAVLPYSQRSHEGINLEYDTPQNSLPFR